MRAVLFRLICRLLVVCLACLPLHAGAELVGTPQAIAAQAARAAPDGAAARAGLAAQLQAHGLADGPARERLAALTDAEAVALAGRLGQLPAGADGGSAIVALMLIAFLAYLIWREAILDGVR